MATTSSWFIVIAMEEKKRNFHDLTVGTPWKVLLLFTIPIFIGNIIGQFYTQIDNIMVGRVMGDTAFGAIGVASSLTYLGTVFACNFPVGASAYTAQLFGAKNYKGVRQSLVANIFLAVVISVIFSAILVCLVPSLLSLLQLQVGSELYNYVALDCYIIFGGLIFPFVFNAFLNFFRAIGDSTTSLILYVVWAVVNMLTDYLFIAVFKWGIAGAAASNLTANFITIIVCVLFIHFKYPEYRVQKEDFHLTWSFLYSHIRLGLPLALQFSILGLGVIFMQGAVDAYGVDAINGFNVGSKVENFLCTFVTAVGSAIGAYVGQNYGAKKYHRVKQGINHSYWILGINLVITMLITYFVRPYACNIFLNEPNESTAYYCSIYMNWDLACYPFLFAIFLFRNVNEGISKPYITFIGGIGELIGRLLMSLVFVNMFGAVSALGGCGVAWVICGMINLIGTIVYVYANKQFKKDEIPSESQPIVK